MTMTVIDKMTLSQMEFEGRDTSKKGDYTKIINDLSFIPRIGETITEWFYSPWPKVINVVHNLKEEIIVIVE